MQKTKTSSERIIERLAILAEEELAKDEYWDEGWEDPGPAICGAGPRVPPIPPSYVCPDKIKIELSFDEWEDHHEDLDNFILENGDVINISMGYWSATIGFSVTSFGLNKTRDGFIVVLSCGLQSEDIEDPRIGDYDDYY